MNTALGYCLGGSLLIVASVFVAWLLSRVPKAKPAVPAARPWVVDRDGRVRMPERRVVVRANGTELYAEPLGKDGE